MQNNDIAELFETLADLLEIKGENPFRIRAYRNAARTIRSLSQEIIDILGQGRSLSEYAGIGKDLAGKIEEISSTGHLSILDQLETQLAPSLVNLMRITGLGGKRVGIIYKKLGLTTIEQLEAAANEHKICQIAGFGEKIEKSILEGIQQFRASHGKFMIAYAEEIVIDLTSYLKKSDFIHQITTAGSFRRCKETVRDIDILATGTDNNSIMNHFLSYPQFTKIISKGETRSTAVLSSGMQIDIRVVPDESYGSALHYFTGSQAHNIGIRKRAVKAGLKVNEYGIYSGDKKIGGQIENDVFRILNLPFIPPELREDQGEIEAAEEGTLPNLVKISDIKGDLHMHTSATDGSATIEEMVQAAIEMGYSYIAITDHSKRLAMTHGLTEYGLASQIELIDRINEKYKRIKILKGIEVDILENGELDLSNSVLKLLDITVCSVHSKFNLSRNVQTERVLRAMDNPYFKILAHPTGRLINRRPPYDINMERILVAAKERNKILEVNSFPDRMDLNASYCRIAKEFGVKMAINTDSHNIGDLRFIKFGIGQARRGWLEPADVINTLSLPELYKTLR